jgi:hypothetical protein
MCHCGEHAWADLTRGYVTFVSPKDARHLQRRKKIAPGHWSISLLMGKLGASTYTGKFSVMLLVLRPTTRMATVLRPSCKAFPSKRPIGACLSAPPA